MLADPAETPVAKPALFMETMLVAEEFQLATRLSGSVEPSLKLPVAVYCRMVAGEIVEAPGVTVIDDSVALLTFRGVDPVTADPLKAAVMFAVPCATPVATPTVAALLLIVAAAAVSDPQVTLFEIF